MPERRRGKFFTTATGLRRKVTYLPPDLEAELRAVAHRLERSEADILREALRAYLDALRQEGRRR